VRNATVVENCLLRPSVRSHVRSLLLPSTQQASEFLKNVYEKDAKSRMVKVVSQGTQTRGVKLATSKQLGRQSLSACLSEGAFKPALVSQRLSNDLASSPRYHGSRHSDTEIIKPTMMSQGTQTVEVAKPAMVSQGTQTIEQALRAHSFRGTQTHVPSLPRPKQPNYPSYDVSLGTQTR